MVEAEIKADEVIIIMKHQGREIHLGEQAKDGEPGLMKGDDQERTRGNCMLVNAWLSLLSLCGRTGLLKEEESWFSFGFKCRGFPFSLKRGNNHCLKQRESLKVQGTEFSELPELTDFSSPSMYSVL